MSIVTDYLNVAGGLIRLIFRPCTLQSATTLLRHRIAHRSDLFLQMTQETIWDYPGSPYRRLLTAAGWTPHTLADHVRQRGVEAALEALRDTGVFLTHDEFKGRKPISRDGVTIECSPKDFDNPRTRPSIEVRTGASRSQGGRVPATIEYVTAQRAPAFLLMLESVGAGAWPSVVWMPAVSHGGGLMWWLSLAHMGRPPVRWFSITDPSAENLQQRHRLMFKLGQIIGMARGLRVPYPEHAPFARVGVVLEAVLAARARRSGCAVITTPSAATRLAAFANEQKTDLKGVAFFVGSEPLTHGKAKEITDTGARVWARYAITEAGAVGIACAHPAGIDDMHFMADSLGLTLAKRELPDGELVDAILLTTLLPSSSKILLNVESDDFGEVTTRRCGCVWDDLGMHTHLANIRSFSKLTGEGVTVLGTDVLRILEEVLPKEFGGRSIDYQLLEVEDTDHLTRLCLVVSPAVGPIDEAQMLRRFVEELRDPHRARSLMPPLWRQAETIRVVRKDPIPTARGKLLPFHTQALAEVGREPAWRG